MTSSGNSPLRLRNIEAADLPLHSALSEQDECYYLFEYTSGKDFTAGAGNDLISNLKKCPHRFAKSPAVLQHKSAAIHRAGQELKRARNPEFIAVATFVPVPPSKVAHDPEYGDRTLQVANWTGTDVRELVRQKESKPAAHVSGPGNRASVRELEDNYEIVESAASPEPKILAVLDDVVTNGSHYVAVRNVLRKRFPSIQIYGFFIARRIFPTDRNVAEDFPDPF